MTTLRRCSSLVWLSVAALCRPLVIAEDAPLCSADEGEVDPALQEIQFEGETFLAYVQPHVTSFYVGTEPPASTAVTPMHEGFAAKFINLSNERLSLYWEPHEKARKPSIIRTMPPFHGGGTSSFPGHRFYFAREHAHKDKVHSFVVGHYPENIYIYDPYYVPDDPEATEKNLAVLTPEEREKYDKLRKTLAFNEVYKNVTGRSYLVNYPRPAPSHYMWRADHFNQTHWVTTRETHFTKMPPAEKLAPIRVHGKKRALKQDDPRLLPEYREEGLFNMTLKVMSCAPRAFEIANFLSPVEVKHIMNLALEEDLHLSSTGEAGADADDDESGEVEKIGKTRTSFNSWLPRDKSPIIDAVYRRAADLLRIDEGLMRYRPDGEHPQLGTRRTIAESLQLVHYEDGQEYTAHHDFGYSAVDSPFQQARFATLLLYLNEGMIGGSTSFPRYVNAETFHKLEAVPEAGKAVLFYSQLPDGNMDDFSQHAAEPVTDGEKWLVNLWVWDPIYEE